MSDTIKITDVLTPGGTVTYWDPPAPNYPTDFDPVTKLTECPLFPDCPYEANGGSDITPQDNH